MKDLTEMSSFFSEIASPYFKTEGAESEDGFIFGEALDELVDRVPGRRFASLIGIGKSGGSFFDSSIGRGSNETEFYLWIR